MKMARKKKRKREEEMSIYAQLFGTNRFDMIGVLFITSCGQESFPRDKFSR